MDLLVSWVNLNSQAAQYRGDAGIISSNYPGHYDGNHGVVGGRKRGQTTRAHDFYADMRYQLTKLPGLPLII